MSKTASIVKIILGIVFLIMGICAASSIEKGTEIVKCYDNNNNEIIGAECIQEIGTRHIIDTLLIFNILLSGGVLLVLGVNDLSNKKNGRL